MGRASRAKRERREQPVEIPHFEVHAQLASAASVTGPEQSVANEEKDN